MLKRSLTPGTAVWIAACILALCACKADTPNKAEKSAANEVKHEVTIGGKM